MSYYFSKTINGNFDDVIGQVMARLKDEGFGVLTHIDVQETLKQKLNLEFRPYVILGACNPHLAHKALSVEDKIGVMLPCNIIIQEVSENRIEVAAVDPLASMAAVQNTQLQSIAEEVRSKLRKVVDALS